MTPRFTRAVGSALGAIAVIMLALFSLEIVLRTIGAGYEPTFFVKGEDGYLHANRNFGRLFFPESTLREGFAGRIKDPKAEDTFRIFLLGESALMGFPAPRFGPARILECMIRESFPGKQYEVVNAAVAGISSHGVLRVAQEIQLLEPDALVVYTGNNEVVGPYGPGSIVAKNVVPLWKARAAMALRSTKIGQALDGWMDELAGTNARQWGGMQMFVDRKVSATDPSMQIVYESFRSNLNDLLSLCGKKGTPVYLSTVAVNGQNLWPFAGAEAIRVYAQAGVLREKGQTTESDALYEKARDLDELRFRADSKINTMIRQAAAKHGDKTILVDAEEIFSSKPDGLNDGDLFWEHVHLTFSGSYQLARALFQSLLPQMEKFFGAEALSLPSEEQVAAKLGYTAMERSFATVTILKMLSQEPFASQPDKATREKRLSGMLRSLEDEWQQQDKSALCENLAAEAARFPDDPWQQVALAQALDACGRSEQSLPVKVRVAQMLPYSVFALKSAGEAQLTAGNLREARNYLLAARKLDTRMPELVVKLSACDMLEDNSESARKTLVDFLEDNPKSVEAWLALAQIARWEKNFSDAREYVEKALETDPQSADVRRELEMVNLESATQRDLGSPSSQTPGTPPPEP
jgi:tetratricopeptide (TPR) repeat protein